MKTFLLSYPRSGNSWVRYIAEYISGKPTVGCLTNPDDVPLFTNSLSNNPLKHVSPDAPPILFKSHGENIDFQEGNNLILLTRSPSVVIRRQKATFALKELFDYIRILNIYDRWHSPKLLIKYEELITNPSHNVLALAAFLNLDKEKSQSFLQNYDHHKKISISLYSDSQSGIPRKGDSITKGELQKNCANKNDIFMVKLTLTLLGKSRYQNFFKFQ